MKRVYGLRTSMARGHGGVSKSAPDLVWRPFVRLCRRTTSLGETRLGDVNARHMVLPTFPGHTRMRAATGSKTKKGFPLGTRANHSTSSTRASMGS